METILKMLSSVENKVKNSQKDPRCSFESYAGYENIQYMRKTAQLFNIQDPFFKVHESVATALSSIKGESYINFSSYNYLNLNGDERVSDAAKEAISRYGTSASASRMVAGERPVHQLLENALAKLHGTENALVFVSGHATNVTTIGYLFGPKDLIIHDEFIHNSAIEGIKLSGATKLSFPHNDWQALDRCLDLRRDQFERILIVIEGHYSMDGDYPELPEFIRIKQKQHAFLMVDEAHSIGVMGKNGRGIGEFFDVDRRDVDIWMGTLSKTLAGCGGYIAGNNVLIEHLKYLTPGFLYSTGIVPPLAAASHAALDIMLEEPERVTHLHERANLFLTEAKRLGLNTGLSRGVGIIPIICGSSRKAVNLSNQLFQKKINVQPIIFPAVPEQQARLRFFINSTHTEEQIIYTLNELHQACT
jgi:8-amino-7-oxononanoate synthase